MLMEEKRIREIEKKTEVFSFGRLQDLANLYKLLKREDVSLKELENYLKAVVKRQKRTAATMEKLFRKRKKEWNRRTRRCPTCMSPLLLRPITVPKGKGNVEGYTCLWYCSNETCLFEEYTKDNFIELYTKVIRGREVG